MKKHLLQAQADEKARKQKRAKLVSESTRILTKIANPMTELTAMMGDTQVVALAPKHFVAEARVLLKALQETHAKAKACMDNPSAMETAPLEPARAAADSASVCVKQLKGFMAALNTYF